MVSPGVWTWCTALVPRNWEGIPVKATCFCSSVLGARVPFHERGRGGALLRLPGRGESVSVKHRVLLPYQIHNAVLLVQKQRPLLSPGLARDLGGRSNISLPSNMSTVHLSFHYDLCDPLHVSG